MSGVFWFAVMVLALALLMEQVERVGAMRRRSRYQRIIDRMVEAKREARLSVSGQPEEEST